MLNNVYRQPQTLTEDQVDAFTDDMIAKGLHPVVSYAMALRDVTSYEVATSQYRLIPPDLLDGIQHLAKTIANGIVSKDKFIVVADYDCDGATACAVAVRGLREMGANIDFVVPNRFIHGYGLTPSVVDVVAEQKPKWIITVDNGIASHAGIDHANSLGIGVLVTDHHLPTETHPNAYAIVNPNKHGCNFPSKNLAGVGVIYYVLAVVRQELGKLSQDLSKSNISALLDIVALGTIADVVKLDNNNRLLVKMGLDRIKKGLACPGIQALFDVSGKDTKKATSQDFGFALGPRINAAGRLEDMTIGIRCLLSTTYEEATYYASQLQEFNEKRKAIENSMKDLAYEQIDLSGQWGNFTRTIFHEDFHEGVIGIVAGRFKEECYTPTVVFAKGGEEGLIKGSGRSIPGVHLRDVLDLVHKRGNNLFIKFGGHAMAAGMTMEERHLPLFMQLFEEATREVLNNEPPTAFVKVDGELAWDDIDIRTAEELNQYVWGQGFEEPTFHNVFRVIEANLIGGGKHLKMKVGVEDREWTALRFFCSDLPQEGDDVSLTYRLSVNEFRGKKDVNLICVNHRILKDSETYVMIDCG